MPVASRGEDLVAGRVRNVVSRPILEHRVHQELAPKSSIRSRA